MCSKSEPYTAGAPGAPQAHRQDENCVHWRRICRGCVPAKQTPRAFPKMLDSDAAELCRLYSSRFCLALWGLNSCLLWCWHTRPFACEPRKPGCACSWPLWQRSVRGSRAFWYLALSRWTVGGGRAQIGRLVCLALQTSGIFMQRLLGCGHRLNLLLIVPVRPACAA